MDRPRPSHEPLAPAEEEAAPPGPGGPLDEAAVPASGPPPSSPSTALRPVEADARGLATSHTHYELDGRWLTEVQVRELLVARGIAVPVPTRADYDETVEDASGWRFVLTTRWVVTGLIVLAYAAIGVGTIALCVQWIVNDVARHDVDAIDSPMAYIVGALLYLAVGVGIFVFVLREKYRTVNRLDPRLWLRELRRLQRRAGREPTDAELEDWMLDGRPSAGAAMPAPARYSVRVALPTTLTTPTRPDAALTDPGGTGRPAIESS